MAYKEDIKIKLEKEIKICENSIKVLKDIAPQIITYGNKVLNRRLITFLEKENANKDIFFYLDNNWLVIGNRNNYDFETSIHIICEENKRINVQKNYTQIEDKISIISEQVKKLGTELQNLDSLCEEYNKIIDKLILFRQNKSNSLKEFLFVGIKFTISKSDYIV